MVLHTEFNVVHDQFVNIRTLLGEAESCIFTHTLTNLANKINIVV
jgi:hypothetical protein